MLQSDRLREQLRALAEEIGPGGRLPTAREMYARFGTNWVTLKAALDRLEAQRVVERRQGSGIYVSRALNRKTVAVLLDAAHFRMPGASPFWGLLWAAIAAEAERRSEADAGRDFAFHLVRSSESAQAPLPSHVMRFVESGGAHAAVAVGLSTGAARWLSSCGVPVAAYAGFGDYVVATQDAEYGRMAMGVLHEAGCSRIAVWRPAAGAQAGTYQEQGYRAAREAYGESGRPRPDGLFIADDMMASGAMVAFGRLGVRVGRDVGVVSLANAGSPALFGYEDVLTRIEVDPAEIAARLFELLDELLVGRQPRERAVVVRARLRPPTR